MQASLPALATLAIFLLNACVTAPAAAKVTGTDPWSPRFTPPTQLDTARMHLEPLSPDHTDMDYAAFMSSRERLRRTLGWGPWPADDMSLAKNRADLEGHWTEFERREAYAYTVQSPDRQLCTGCIYVNPVELPGAGCAATLTLWVTDAALEGELDLHLLASLLEWFERDWPFDAVFLPLQAENERGLELAAELNLPLADTQAFDGRQVYVWRRSGAAASER